MWQRLTEDAQRVVLLGWEEAKLTHSSSVDTEHLLLGLFVFDDERMVQLLETAGAQSPEVRAEATEAVKAYKDTSPKLMARLQQFGRWSLGASKDKEPQLGPLVALVLEFAAGEARQAQHTSVAPEHLFLALLRETQGRASQILRAQGTNIDKARVAVMERIATEAPYWANPSQMNNGDEEQLLSLLERREDLSVEILGLDVLALKKLGSNF